MKTRHQKLKIHKKCLYSDRTIISYRKKPFYKSTGRNSKNKNMWFPFRKIEDSGWINKGYFGLQLYSKIYDLKKYYKYNLYELASRLGTKKNTEISYSLGGPFWNSKIGKKISNKLKLKKVNIIIDDKYSLKTNEPKKINKFIESLKI
jgi:hypothetical protein